MQFHLTPLRANAMSGSIIVKSQVISTVKTGRRRARTGRRVALCAGFGLSIALCWGEPASAKRGCVATVHPLATDAALDAFRTGGNAVDAAVAAALTLGVVDGHNSGIGGGWFLLIRRANGETIAIDRREAPPA